MYLESLDLRKSQRFLFCFFNIIQKRVGWGSLHIDQTLHRRKKIIRKIEKNDDAGMLEKKRKISMNRENPKYVTRIKRTI